MNNVSTINLPVSTFGNIDDILVNASGSAGRIKKVDFLGAMNDWNNITNKPFENFDNTYFRTTERSDGADILTLSDNVIAYFGKVDTLQADVIALDAKIDENYQASYQNLSDAMDSVNNSIGSMSSYFSDQLQKIGTDFSNHLNNTNSRVSELEGNSHIHNNMDVIDLFTISDNKLLWNGTAVGSDYELPVATASTLGGVKPDGTTITVDDDGTIHGASQGLDFNALSTAMTTGTLIGISITADNENSRFNFEVTGIPTVAIDSEGYWTVDGERGENPTKAQGEKGNDGLNGKDGASPTIDPTTKNWIVGTVDTGVKAEAQSNYFYTGTEFPTSDLIDGDLYLSFAENTKGNVYQYQGTTLDWALQGNLYGGGAVIDDTSTVGNTVTWSASKINSVIGDINSVLASVTGGVE